ncbi:MAG TPA: DUF6800 family protein [Candidatus Binatia bacterium]|jgi:hypothetical protein|nr:DUF6800 family protein [Candidatus Binatia bacterium]
MSRQVRQNELHRQRARRWSLRKLREQYARSKTAAEKEQILQKVIRVAPTASKEQFLAAIKVKS